MFFIICRYIIWAEKQSTINRVDYIFLFGIIYTQTNVLNVLTVLKILITIETDYCYQGGITMTANEIELLKLIRENDKPEEIASYMISLFLDYLHKPCPFQEISSVVPQESA